MGGLTVIIRLVSVQLALDLPTGTELGNVENIFVLGDSSPIFAPKTNPAVSIVKLSQGIY